MLSIRYLILLAGCNLWVSLLTAQPAPRYHKAKIDLHDKPPGALAAEGIATDHGIRKPGGFYINIFSEAKLEQLEAAGFAVEILEEDMARKVRERYEVEQTGDLRQGRSHGCETTTYTTPNQFTLGSLFGFFTYDEMLAHLDSMAVRYPDLITPRKAIGDDLTHGGDSIYYVKISQNPDIDQGKPQVLYTALHHAREPGSLASLIFYMYYLLENYDTDPEVRFLVDSTAMYFVPCVNPDGYKYVETNDLYWRKNRRDNGGGSYGVDLNRNYGYKWGYDDNGSSPDSNAQVYRGPSSFSEPETDLLRQFVVDHNFRIAQNFHTYGNMLINPWGYEDKLTPDSVAFTCMGNHMTEINQYLTGTGMQTVGYLTNGDSDDWMYGAEGVYAYTPEAGYEGFWPPSSRIIPICKENLSKNLATARLVHNHATTQVNGSILVSDTGTYLPFTLQRVGLDSGSFTVTLQPLDTHVIATGAPTTISGLTQAATVQDSIAFSVNPSTTMGTPIRLLLSVDNGNFTHSDTVVRYFGPVDVLLYDAAADLSNWNTNAWGKSSSVYYSPPASFGDSPGGNYTSNMTNRIWLAEPVDLSYVYHAELSFYARWSVEPRFDYVQLEVSTDPDSWSWTPLCGRYTRAGHTFQEAGEPLYDGLQDEWVQERIDLSAWAGEEVWLRFRLVSDDYDEREGFFFDELTIQAIQDEPPQPPPDTTYVPGSTSAVNWKVYPNPSGGHLTVETDAAWPMHQVSLRDLTGRIVWQQLPPDNPHRQMIEVDKQPAGMYILEIRTPRQTHYKKVIIQGK